MKYVCILIHYISGAYLQNTVVISNNFSREENFTEKKYKYLTILSCKNLKILLGHKKEIEG